MIALKNIGTCIKYDDFINTFIKLKHAIKNTGRISY